MPRASRPCPGVVALGGMADEVLTRARAMLAAEVRQTHARGERLPQEASMSCAPEGRRVAIRFAA